MIRLKEHSSQDSFDVFDMADVYIGTVSREDLVNLVGYINATLGKGQAELVTRFIRARSRNQTLFQEAIEHIK